jgi:hypothetical protein
MSGHITGSVEGASLMWDSLSYKSRKWVEHIKVEVAAVTGDADGTTFTAPMTCTVFTVSGNCARTGSGFWSGQSGELETGDNVSYSGELGWESPAPTTTVLQFQATMTFTIPDANPVVIVIGPLEPIRCDSETIFKPTKGGCVYPLAVKNIIKISVRDPSVRQAAEFVRAAQVALRRHPGVLHQGPALTRLTNPSKIRANRRAACRHVTVRKGESCDEYPFASTYQGAALAGPTNFKSKAINAKQNSKAGTYLGIFFLRYRIADGDPFYVSVVG